MLAAALFLSAAGDIALALTPPRWIAGMGFFGAAHILYAVVFVDLVRARGLRRSGLPLAGAVLVVSAAMLVWFLPDMGALRGPGLAYQAIITVMVAAALVSPAPSLARAGAVLFMLSDTLIALGLYKGLSAPPGSVWLTYAAAQALLAAGLAAGAAAASPKSPT